MKKNMVKVSMAAFVLGLGVVAVTAGNALGVIRPCFRGNCLDVWRPVTCANGVTYSNDCYAARACQYNCTPGNPQI